ncbi:DUF2442 domain-containing protein [Moorella sp. Hama-1]|uniref:DUF2442 domain-containing protein n=1 Tax=Moorella sp. Hama-1 TaxID=2138101 RepID=UPI00137B0F11|nr:DUF2442 domain-containing protein [Moorella sp. Hama-1]BCV22915.1 hypothetical protein hamaS1_29840 [Moorella sp. Hama-1]
MIPPALIQVYPDKEKNYAIICQFVDGKVTRYHMQNMLSGVFAPLRDKEVFKNTLTILDNTAAWDLTGKRDETNCLTIDPWTLYNAEDITGEMID